MSSASDSIARALTKRGITFDTIEWFPIRRGSEMEGPIGGWEVWSGGSMVAWGYNARSVVKAIESPDGLANDRGYGVLHLRGRS